MDTTTTTNAAPLYVDFYLHIYWTANVSDTVNKVHHYFLCLMNVNVEQEMTDFPWPDFSHSLYSSIINQCLR